MERQIIERQRTIDELIKHNISLTTEAARLKEQDQSGEEVVHRLTERIEKLIKEKQVLGIDLANLRVDLASQRKELVKNTNQMFKYTEQLKGALLAKLKDPRILLDREKEDELLALSASAKNVKVFYEELSNYLAKTEFIRPADFENTLRLFVIDKLKLDGTSVYDVDQSIALAFGIPASRLEITRAVRSEAMEIWYDTVMQYNAGTRVSVSEVVYPNGSTISFSEYVNKMWRIIGSH